MKVTANANTSYLSQLDANALRNFWYEAFYHSSRFAIGKGSKRYVRALANYASNLSTFKLCGEDMYSNIAEKCANEANKLFKQFADKD